MDAESARSIGISFIKQYYKVLSSETDLVGKFYQDISNLSYNNTSLANGCDEIQKAYLEHGFDGMEMEIHSGSFLPAVDGGILIVVTGEMTSKAGVARKVCQTFLLTPSSEEESRRLFVFNDILVCIEGPAFVHGGDMSSKSEPPKEEEEKIITEPPVIEKEPENVKKPEVEKTPAPPKPTKTQVEKVAKAPVEKSTHNHEKQDKKPNHSKKSNERPPTQEKPAPPAVVSYAQMLSKSTPAPPEASKSASSSDESLEIFVKDIQKDWNEEKLSGVFGVFGEITNVHIPSNKKFAFVTYKNAASVKAAMEARPIEIDGKPVVVEIRHAKAEAPASQNANNGKKNGAKDRPPRGEKPKSNGNNAPKKSGPPAKGAKGKGGKPKSSS